jgi:hypothetical protein
LLLWLQEQNHVIGIEENSLFYPVIRREQQAVMRVIQAEEEIQCTPREEEQATIELDKN